MTEKQTVYIDNMVCSRCKTAVEQLAVSLGWRVEEVKLGRLTGWPPDSDREQLRLGRQLKSLGFDIKRGSGSVVSRIKGLIIDYVYREQEGSNIPLSQLISADIGQSYSHLSRLFTREEGRTIGDYYRLQRMERAKQLLVNTDEQVSLIAYRLHYGSLGRFTSAFKRSVGVSPTVFRERGVHSPVPLDEL